MILRKLLECREMAAKNENILPEYVKYLIIERY